jgi:8-oxo-dGTP pyrophosphatase MutT (NUDIX family)
MPNQQPTIIAASGRRFAASAAAILAFLVNAREELLLLARPRCHGQWEVINGAIEREETVLEAALRETREEVGAARRVRPLGAFHAYTVRYDDNVQYMISICYLVACDGGAAQPGDDMAGSAVRWWCLADLADAQVRLLVPRDEKWLAARAIEAYRLWHTRTVPLEAERDGAGRDKSTL